MTAGPLGTYFRITNEIYYDLYARDTIEDLLNDRHAP